MHARILFAAMIALAGCSMATREGVSRDHEAALQHYLSASRTLVMVRESFIPMAIKEGAVERWGFDAGSLDAVRVARIRSYGDEAALLDYVVALHVRNLDADDLREAARFLETEAGRTVLSSNIGDQLPRNDPLYRAEPPRLTPAGKQRYDEFMQSRIGVRVEQFDALLSRELPWALAKYVDKAMEIYVREAGLPNRRDAEPKP